MRAKGQLTRPDGIDATEAWFWSAQWQAGEREADADRSGGRVETFGSGEELLGALGARAKRPGRRRKS